MEYFWWLYLATRLDAIQGLFNSTMIIGIVGFVILGFGYLMSDGDAVVVRAFTWWRRWGTIFTIFGAVMLSLTPSKKDAMFIAGGIGVIEGAKALQGSEMAKKSVEIVEQWLQNNLTELQSKGKDLEKKK